MQNTVKKPGRIQNDQKYLAWIHADHVSTICFKMGKKEIFPTKDSTIFVLIYCIFLLANVYILDLMCTCMPRQML